MKVRVEYNHDNPFMTVVEHTVSEASLLEAANKAGDLVSLAVAGVHQQWTMAGAGEGMKDSIGCEMGCRSGDVDKIKPEKMLDAVSARLREAGKTLIGLGKQIEATQVEDGDPPFRITHLQHEMLCGIINVLVHVKDSVTTEGEADDQGESVLDSTIGHD